MQHITCRTYTRDWLFYLTGEHLCVACDAKRIDEDERRNETTSTARMSDDITSAACIDEP